MVHCTTTTITSWDSARLRICSVRAASSDAVVVGNGIIFQESDKDLQMIKTYPIVSGAFEGAIVPYDKRKKKLVPGLRVKHSLDPKSDGIIIAIANGQISVMWSIVPETESFRNFVLPLFRRVYQGLTAQQLVSVQPMAAPAGGIFYMDYTYGDAQKVQTALSGSV